MLSVSSCSAGVLEFYGKIAASTSGVNFSFSAILGTRDVAGSRKPKKLLPNDVYINYPDENDEATRERGVTPPICIALPTPEDLACATELELVLQQLNAFESNEESNHKKLIVIKIKDLTKVWIERTFAPNADEGFNVEIYIFGSTKLKADLHDSDLDLLMVAPEAVERSDFFHSWAEILNEQDEIENLKTVQEAFVPLIKFTIDSIEVDMLFARLALKDIPENQDLRDVNLLKNLDPKCIRSLNGCRVTDEILHLVPNRENFRLALRSIKLWAKKHGIYSNVLGYLGGVSWAMLVARTCQLYPNATSAALVHKFFLVFSKWPLAKPVILKQPEENKFGFDIWDPRANLGDRFHLMPIITPAYPQQNSTFNVSFSTRTVMYECFKHGLSVCEDIMAGNSGWHTLFQAENFFNEYQHFIILIASARSKNDHLEWNTFVKSKITLLISHLERHPVVNYARVKPNPYTCVKTETGIWESKWSIGLKCSEEAENFDFAYAMQNFEDDIQRKKSRLTIFNIGMTIKTDHVLRDNLLSVLPRSVLGLGNEGEPSHIGDPDVSGGLIPIVGENSNLNNEL